MKKHIERSEKEKNHFQNLRHQVEIENIKKGRIPSYVKFKDDPLLKSTNQHQKDPGFFEAIAATVDNNKLIKKLQAENEELKQEISKIEKK
jgi:hypothetical protein